MDYVKKDLYNTSLPVLIIEENKCYEEYPTIGHGEEGTVHKYNDNIAFKIFNLHNEKYREKLLNKFEKIELLGQLHDPAVCFPIGLIGYKDKKKEGYYYDLVNPLKNYKDFYALRFLNDMSALLEYIIKADEAIQRFHKLGCILGDIKEDNIMIDCNGNVKFIDTDNWIYKGYGFDLKPRITNLLNSIYKKNFSLIDNDRLVFGMMAIQFFVDGSIIRLHCSDEYFKELIELMDVNQEIKDGLRLIFSDAQEKPYIGPILKKINPKQKILSKDAIRKIWQKY